MSRSPQVSVILPTFNRETFLPRAIQTVLSQSFEDFELIVVDDGSTDGTPAILRRLAADNRVTIVSHDNSGPSAARNRGLDVAAGRYVVFIDSDNFWLPERLKTHLDYLDVHPEVHVVYGEEWIVGPDGTRLSQSKGAGVSGSILLALLHNKVINFNNATFRSSLFRDGLRFDTSMRGGEDFDLLLRLSPLACFHYLPDPLVEYAIGHDRISDQGVMVREANLRAIDQFLDQHGPTLPRDVARSAAATTRARYSAALSDAGQHGAAIGWSLRAVAVNPFGVAAWRSTVRAIVKSALRS